MFPMVSAAFSRLSMGRTTTPPPNDDTESLSSETISPTTFYPSVADVLKVRFTLRWKIVAEGLPQEIVDMIIDAAEYWASAEVKMEGSTRVIRQDGDQVLVRTVPLCYDPEVGLYLSIYFSPSCHTTHVSAYMVVLHDCMHTDHYE